MFYLLYYSVISCHNCFLRDITIPEILNGCEILKLVKYFTPVTYDIIITSSALEVKSKYLLVQSSHAPYWMQKPQLVTAESGDQPSLKVDSFDPFLCPIVSLIGKYLIF